MNSVPLTGSPPMPTAVDLAEALVGGLEHRFVGQRARAADDADAALLEDVAGHDADLALVRASARPGSSARSAATSSRSSARLTLTMSSTGMPSVMVTISGTSASIASRIEVRGERRRDVDHATRSRRSSRPPRATVSNTGRPRCVGAALARRHAADHLRAVGERLLRVERAGLAGHALGDDLGVAVDEDAHATASSARLLSICLQATSSSFTASTLTSKFSLGLVVQLDLDDPLDAAGADHHRHADIEVVDAILAGQVRGAGQDALLVLEDSSRPSRSRWSPARNRPSRSSAARRSRRRRRGCA